MRLVTDFIPSLASSPTQRVVGMAIVIGVGVSIGVAFLMIARRRLLRAEREAEQPMTLSHAREMLAQGRISNAEFESLRGALLRAGRADGPGRPRDPGAGKPDRTARREGERPGSGSDGDIIS